MQVNDRKTYAIYFYVCFIIFSIVRYFDGLFLFQIAENPIRSPRVDPLVWFIQYLGLPKYMSHPVVQFFFDGAIILLPIIILIRVLMNKKINRIADILVLFFGIYILMIYCFPTLSIRKYLGLVLIPIAFIFRSKSRYLSYLEVMRYYVLFVFTSASIWKIARGVAWDPTHMQESLKVQHIDNFIHWPDHYITKIIAPIIDNPMYCSVLLLGAVVTQLLFGIGFFTKKYDKFLAALLILFIISDYLVMRIEYWEFIVFLPLLLFKPKQTEYS